MRITISICAAALLAGCAAGESQYFGSPPVPALRVQESDAGKPITIEPGRRLILRLEANHTLGYRWILASSSGNSLEPIGVPYYTGDNLEDKGGAEYWTFVPRRAGTHELRFEYRRPWEKDKAADKALSYTVNVR